MNERCNSIKIDFLFSFVAGKEPGGRISVKHIYEIAKVKIQGSSLALKCCSSFLPWSLSLDEPYQGLTMKDMCRLLIQQATKIGMEVVSSLNVEEHKKYMDELRALHERQAKEAEEAQQAKLLRGATATAEKAGKK